MDEMKTETTTVVALDLGGNEIAPGAYVVYSALWDRSAVLKYGRVTRTDQKEVGWGERREIVATLRVMTVDHGWCFSDAKKRGEWHLQKSGKEVTLGFTERCLVVGPGAIPLDARMLLDEAYNSWKERKKR